MAGLAILSRTELLLVVLGGLFAVVTLSSIIQTGWFKYTRITHRHRAAGVPDGAVPPPLRAAAAGTRSPSSSGSGSSPGWRWRSEWACSTPSSSAMADAPVDLAGRTVLVCGVRFAGRVGGPGPARARGSGVARRPAPNDGRRSAACRRRARSSATPTRCRPGSSWSSPRPGCARPPAAARRAAPPAFRCSASSNSPGGCGTGPARRWLLSPARTARPPPSGCSNRSCSRPAGGAARSATSGYR